MRWFAASFLALAACGTSTPDTADTAGDTGGADSGDSADTADTAADLVAECATTPCGGEATGGAAINDHVSPDWRGGQSTSGKQEQGYCQSIGRVSGNHRGLGSAYHGTASDTLSESGPNRLARELSAGFVVSSTQMRSFFGSAHATVPVDP